METESDEKGAAVKFPPPLILGMPRHDPLGECPCGRSNRTIGAEVRCFPVVRDLFPLPIHQGIGPLSRGVAALPRVASLDGAQWVGGAAAVVGEIEGGVEGNLRVQVYIGHIGHGAGLAGETG